MITSSGSGDDGDERRRWTVWYFLWTMDDGGSENGGKSDEREVASSC